jgi:hypothetical protein
LQSAQALREKQVTEFKSDFKEPWGWLGVVVGIFNRPF